MKNYRIGYFISPHGYGHAARSSAIMQALTRLSTAYEFEIFTRVPEWFFQDSVKGRFRYHELTTDVGLVQSTALQEDISQTLERLQELYPLRPNHLKDIAQQVQALGCDCIVCDIAPIGIGVAQVAGIPSILVENFTWDWIYGGYATDNSELNRYIEITRELFESADYHVQTEPVCRPTLADLLTRPVSREPRTASALVRRKLGVRDAAKMVLITMGGIPERHAFVDRLGEYSDTIFVIPGASEIRERFGNVILLPHRSEFYHPDLLHASDLVVGKSGYSTVAEAYYAGVPLGYVSRPRFRESGVIAQFVQEQMQGLEISDETFTSGSWLAMIPDLLALPRIDRTEVNGSVQVARFINRAV